MEGNYHQGAPIPLLRENNYNQWKKGVQSLLIIRDLWDVVNPDAITPDVKVKMEDGEPNQTEKEKVKREAEASMILNGYLSENIANSIDLALLSARELWIVLQNRFEKKAVTRVVEAIEKLKNDPENETDIERLNRMRESFSVLQINNINFEQMAILYYLVGLPKDHGNLHMHWYQIPIHEWNLDKFMAHMTTVTSTPWSTNNLLEVAMRADTTVQGKKGNDKKKTGKWCKLHKVNGHNSDECYTLRHKNNQIQSLTFII
ncbi:hypothetical protein IWQ61_006202 [Dispira simplex]|nr:hypothetical protein IWQ61_006202 [Dispira simplex]